MPSAQVHETGSPKKELPLRKIWGLTKYELTTKHPWLGAEAQVQFSDMSDASNVEARELCARPRLGVSLLNQNSMSRNMEPSESSCTKSFLFGHPVFAFHDP